MGKIIHCPWMCTNSLMSGPIWMTCTRLLSTYTVTGPCRNTHTWKTHTAFISHAPGWQVVFSLWSGSFRPATISFNSTFSRLPSKPLFIQIPLWSGRPQPAHYWLRAYNVSSPPILELSSSPDVYLSLLLKRQALDQHNKHKEPFQLCHNMHQLKSMWRMLSCCQVCLCVASAASGVRNPV